MLYFKVKPEYDNYRKTKIPILVGNELLTKAEKERYNVPDKAVTQVQVKKTEIYWFFGARFSE